MKLLVSVRSVDEAAAALAGGAGVIDAKEPRAGALGAVDLEVFAAVHGHVAGGAPVTAAIGDTLDVESAARTALAFSEAGAWVVKLGFTGAEDLQHVSAVIAAAVRGARDGRGRAGVIAVAYADAPGMDHDRLEAFTASAAAAGAAGILLDTSDKAGSGIRRLMPGERLACWARRAHDLGLLAAAAGQLTAGDLVWVRDAGADIAGVRGAACAGGRNGAVSARLVRELGETLRRAAI